MKVALVDTEGKVLHDLPVSVEVILTVYREYENRDIVKIGEMLLFPDGKLEFYKYGE